MRDARARASTSAAEIRVTADDVAHYAYAREGNAHVVFRYTGPRPELRGALLRLLKTPAGGRGDRAWRCHAVDALVWGADRDEASWTTLDAAARDAFFADAPTTSGRAGWRDDRAVARVDGDALNMLALKMTRDAAREAARAEGRDGRVANAAEAFGQLSEVAAETSHVFEDDAENAWVIEIKPKSFVGAIVDGRRAWRFPAHQRLKVARGERDGGELVRSGGFIGWRRGCSPRVRSVDGASAEQPASHAWCARARRRARCNRRRRCRVHALARTPKSRHGRERRVRVYISPPITRRG